MNFNEHYVSILNARSPEELFPDVRTAADLRKAVRRLSAAVHPDVNPQNTGDAEAAFKRMTTWAERAALKIKAGDWRDGKLTAEFEFKTGVARYAAFGLFRREALFDSIDVTADGRTALLHVARVNRYEPTVANAIRAIKNLGGSGSPTFIDYLKLRGREVYVTTPVPHGFVTLASLMDAASVGRPPSKLPPFIPEDGIPPAVLLPCVPSLLLTLIRLSRFDLLHGAINPSTWWVNLETSESYLTDWHYSVRRGEVVAYQNDTYAGLSPWEIREKRITDRGTDLAAVMLVLRAAFGCHRQPAPLEQLIQSHLCENRERPSDPVACLLKIRELL